MANIDKELNQIKNAVYGREVRGSIHDGIKKINEESEDSKSKATEAHDVMESIMTEGFDNAALESNFEQKLDDKISNLQPEWTGFKEDVTTQLAETDSNAFRRGLTMTKEKKAQIVFIDDDIRKEVLEYLKPIVLSEKVPITLAAITSTLYRENDPEYLSLKEVKELDEIGFEIVSHSHTHQRLSDLSREELINELQESKKIMYENGFNHNVLVYPYGAFGGIQHIVSQYYQAAVRTDYGKHLLNKPPILQMQLERVYFNYQDGTQNVDLCKLKIDEAVDNDEFLIIGSHCWYDGFDPDGYLDVVRYAKQSGAEIVTMQEAINNYGNYIDLPDFKIGANGEVESTKFGNATRLPLNSVNGFSTFDDFPDGFSLSVHTDSGGLAGLPTNNSGMMLSYKYPFSVTHSYHVYHASASGRIYTAQMRSSNSQKDWLQITIDKFNRDRDYNLGTIAPNSCKEFPNTDTTLYGGDNTFIYKNITKLPPGIIYQQSSDEGEGGNTTYHHFCNITEAPIEVGTVTVRETEIRGL